ncbi:TetR/AcrR family transcriptional regulator [Nocardioides sp. KR10-350]|uniref:TetR/AcrR family transcriptional regulator n=1 Tax=Nocardioides cheoyonin TaxID=3156615 RepID=UPI0032B37678
MASRKGTAGGSGGRRRADGSRSESPRDEIIRVATRLFAEQGYAATTMKGIAEAAGLRQPSVYYWFRNKEELLHATASINRYSASVVVGVEKSEASVSARLYRLLYEDTRQICVLGPLDYREVESVAYARPDEFDEFWTDYRALYDGIVDLIEDGMQTGDFHPGDPSLAAAVALSLNEGLQKFHRHRVGPGGALGLPAPVPDLDDAVTAAHQSATTTLSALLRDRHRVADVRIEAMEILLDVEGAQAS